MKAKSVFALFAIIGLGVTAGGVAYTYNEIRFVQRAANVQGNVIRNERVRGSKGRTNYAPVVAFQTRDGERVEFRSDLRSSSPRYGVGQPVPVLYDPAKPSTAEIKGFMEQWMAAVVLGILGLAFLGVGGGMLVASWRRKALFSRLMMNGARTKGLNPRLEVDTTVAMNHRHPYRIVCEAEFSGTVQTCKSDRIWSDPTSYLQGRTIEVLYDPQEPKKYCVDISFLPSEIIG